MKPPSRHARPLPEPVCAALGSIATDMRNVPRECLRDPMELFVWLRRQAARVEGVRRMQVEEGPRPAPRRAPARQTPREKAEALFSRQARTAQETITCRQGRVVRVERRARQLEMIL